MSKEVSMSPDTVFHSAKEAMPRYNDLPRASLYLVWDQSWRSALNESIQSMYIIVCVWEIGCSSTDIYQLQKKQSSAN